VDLAWKPGLVSGLASWAEDDPKPSTMLCALLVPTDEDEVMEDPVCAVGEEAEDEELEELKKEYSDIFEDKPGSFIKYPPLRIPWDGTIPAGAWSSGYKLDPEDMDFLDAEVEGWAAADLCRRHYRPGIFAAGLFATKTPTEIDVHRKRSVVNYRPGINRALLPIQFPQPTIQSLFDGIAGCHFFSLMDLRSGYHQLRIEEGSQHLLVFRHRDVLWRPTRLFEGVSTACAQFQGAMVDIHKTQMKRGRLKIHLDDHFIATTTKEQHLKELREFFLTCRRRCVKLKRPKCCFLVRRIDVVGRRLEKGTVRPPDTYMRKIWRVEKPANVGELYRFLGMVVWIVQHLPRAILICDLLYKMFPNDRRSKRHKLEWTDDALETWDELQGVLHSPYVLSLPDLGRPFVIQVDSAHSTGVGAVLMQCDQGTGVLHPVEFWSSRWKYKWEQDAPPRTLELNGLVQALRHWAHYVRNGHPIAVYSDHRSLSQSLVPRADDDVHVRNLLGALAVFDVVINYSGKVFRWAGLAQPRGECTVKVWFGYSNAWWGK